jgi:hypothetical protein
MQDSLMHQRIRIFLIVVCVPAVIVAELLVASTSKGIIAV